MRVECVCGRWHDITPTGLALIVYAFQRGDLHRQTRVGPTSICIAEAFKDKALVEKFVRRYPGNRVGISGLDMRLDMEGNFARAAEDAERASQALHQRTRERSEGSSVEAEPGSEEDQETGSEASRGPE